MNDSTKYTSVSTLIIIVATAVTVAKLLNAVPLRSANDRSRWCTVWSIVERQSYAIDEIDARTGWSTIDKVRFKDHYFSSKPPLLPRLVSEVAAAVKQTTGLSLDTDTTAASRVILLFVNVLPTVVSWVVLAWMLPKFSRSLWGCLFALLVACFATLNAPFLVTFNNHSVAIWSLMLTIGCMTWMTLAGPRMQWLASACAGLFAAWTCCNELPAAPFGLLVFLWAWRQNWKTAWLAFVPAAVIPLGGFFYTNWQVTGTWKPFYLTYGTETYRYIVDGVPSYWLRPAGLDTNPDSTPTYFLHCTVGHHGILSLTPVFLMTFLVWLGFGKKFSGGRTTTDATKAENRVLTPGEVDEKKPQPSRKSGSASPLSVFAFVRHVGLLLTAVTIGFFLSKTENYNYGGTSCALRWTLWLTPFWTIGMLPALVSLSANRFGRGFAGVLLAASIGSAWYPGSNPWQHPWIYNAMVAAEMVKPPAAITAPLDPPHSWIQSLPPAGTSVEYQVDGVTRESVKLSVVENRNGRVTLEWIDSTGQSEFVVDEAKFARNDTVGNWLVSSTRARAEAIRFLRGLPLARPYNPGKRAYVKTSAFDDHRSTWRLASRVYDQEARRQTRTDIWVAADDDVTEDRADTVPFGLIQMIITTTDRRGVLLGREIWSLKSINATPSD